MENRMPVKTIMPKNKLFGYYWPDRYKPGEKADDKPCQSMRKKYLNIFHDN